MAETGQVCVVSGWVLFFFFFFPKKKENMTVTSLLSLKVVSPICVPLQLFPQLKSQESEAGRCYDIIRKPAHKS